MQEIYRTSLYTDFPREELRLILFSQKLCFEVYRQGNIGAAAALVSRLSLPLSLWHRFYETVCCLGNFMKPLPAPAYQARSCCSYTCSLTPEPVVLEQDHEKIRLSLLDRRGSTFLEITSVPPAQTANSVEADTIRIGPTLWSAFLTTMQRLAQIITP